ncbi:hypothetical protein DFH09DRAFT_1203820 [Mycena vulgaris]|nr:hypothetical protein DFH09DRAFT_1203820 [Mycena vulgaris]
MPQKPHLRSPPTCSWSGIMGTICGIATLAAIIWGMKLIIQDTMATEKKLLSRITSDTPISGFYGPGAWWVWLITLGMTNSHTSLALLKGGELPLEWDYDLIGASCYTAAAAIDLILKARRIAALDSGSQSVLLPALLCAERVVMSLLTSPHGWHLIPMVLALAAAPFTWRAHEAIVTTAPVPWCLLHDGKQGVVRLKALACTDVDLVLFLPVQEISPLEYLKLYLEQDHWIFAGMLTAIATCVAFLVACIVYWPAVYISAFLPRGGYFPLTGISVLEMDQIAALLAVVAVVVIRGYKFILRLQRAHNAPGDSESHALLPITNAGTE